MYASFVGVGPILCVFSFLFGFEGGMWDVIVLIPDHGFSIFFTSFVLGSLLLNF